MQSTLVPPAFASSSDLLLVIPQRSGGIRFPPPRPPSNLRMQPPRLLSVIPQQLRNPLPPGAKRQPPGKAPPKPHHRRIVKRKPMRHLLAAALLLAAVPAPSQTAAHTPEDLTALGRTRAPALQQAIRDTFPAKELAAGTAFRGHLHSFFFAVQAPSSPTLVIDGADPNVTAVLQQQLLPMQGIEGTDIYYASATIQQLGTLHSFSYELGGKPFGGRLDLPAFTDVHYPQPSVPQGKLSTKLSHISRIYDGMQSDYWIYVPAQYTSTTPAALMVFQDGSGYGNRDGDHGILNDLDNLIAGKQIPVMIAVFIDPGDISAHPGTPTYKSVDAYSRKWSRTLKDSLRSTEYDTVSDRYPRFLRDEILADVAGRYNIRKDSYSRAITGLSSGGICAFNAGWQQPDQFSRVLTWIGSFTAIQWHEVPGVPDGGQDFPEKVLREPHRNLRVWLADGANDMENDRYGSWPLANIRMSNALHLKGYDMHFSFNHGTHNPAHGASEFPAEMTWLWRGYDPAKTAETFTQEPGESSAPPFRVLIANRPAR